MKRKWPIVEVEWEDSKGWPGWTHIEDVLAEASKACSLTQYTVGYLIRRDRRYIVVAGSQADTESSDTANGSMQIPRSAIRSLRILRERE